MPNNTHGRNHAPFSGREFREVERLRTIIADFAEKYFGVHEELEVVQAANRDLRAQNKFLVSDNAKLEAENKQWKARRKALQDDRNELEALLLRNGIVISHVDGHVIGRVDFETKRSEPIKVENIVIYPSETKRSEKETA